MKAIGKIITLTLFVFSTEILKAQCVITAIRPPEQFTLDQVWNLIIVNSASADIFKLNLTIREDGKSIYDADSKSFAINTSPLTINFRNKTVIEPLNVKTITRQLNDALTRSGGLFPAGDYTFEFKLLSVNRRGSEELCRTSYLMNIEENISPLKLLYVHNEDTIRDACPTFGWLAPVPLPKGEFYYELTLTECHEGQQPGDATRENIPVYKMAVGKMTAKNLCSDVSNLEKGKMYAWQINIVQPGKTKGIGIAYNESAMYTSNSWKFYYEPEDSTEFVYEGQYYVMNEKIYASYVIIDSNLLPIKFMEDYDVLDSIVDIKLYDSTMTVIASDSDIILTYKPGTNLTYLNFCNYDLDVPKGRYVLEVICLNNKKYFIRFKNISEPESCY